MRDGGAKPVADAVILGAVSLRGGGGGGRSLMRLAGPGAPGSGFLAVVGLLSKEGEGSGLNMLTPLSSKEGGGAGSALENRDRPGVLGV